MSLILVLRNLVVLVLIAGLVNLGPAASTARAELVTAAAVAANVETMTPASPLRAALARAEVRAELRQLGVDPEEVAARIASLSDAEVAAVDRRLGELPAGGSLFLTLLLVVVVLMVTDLLGITDIFPFIGHVKWGQSSSPYR